MKSGTPDVKTQLKSEDWELHTSGHNQSSWFKDIDPIKFEKLSRYISVDVAMVGR